jgi:hypothetical protein
MANFSSETGGLQCRAPTTHLEETPMLLRRTLTATALATLLSTVVALAPAQQPKARAVATADAAAPNVATAHGTVVGSDKSSLTIKPRSANGKFDKEMILQITGTSHVTQLSYQTTGGKTIAKQLDADAKDLKADQAIAVIYTKLDSGPVLLSAIVVAAGK